MIDVQHLVKWYGPTRAIDDLTFHIESGQIVGFLGPNGAGKTTTLRILTGYLPPTSGRATVAGHDVLTDSLAARTRIGYLPENTPLYPEMRVEEYLHYRGRLYGMDRAARRQRIDVVCDRCGLAAVRRRLIGQLSRGNKQRVGLAQALLHDPQVLILDEPTAGLDPTQIGHVRDLVRELRGKHTVVLSTHILPEVERIADRVLIIAGGRIVAEGAINELRESVATASGLHVEVKAPPETVRSAFGGVDGVTQIEATMDNGWCRAIVGSSQGHDLRERLGQVIASNGWPVREMRYERATLEEFFIRITAEQDRPDADQTRAATATER
ncbi:MAG: ABC transporter ATP-binding protein [Phycisphaeraceae bacterium]